MLEELQAEINETFKNIKIKEVRNIEFESINQIELIFEIKDLSNDFRVNIDRSYIQNFDELIYLIGNALRKEILKPYLKEVQNND